MVVSKRGLLKVIILLAIIDVIAGFWYLTLRIENSGESRDFWLPDSVTEAADTIAEQTAPDSFKIVNNHGYFITKHSVDTSFKQLASIKLVNARIPINVNGCDSLDLLNRELVSKAFGFASDDFEGGMAIYTSRPTFNHRTTLPYDDVERKPSLAPEQTTTEAVAVYPLYTSNRIMVWEIDYWRNNCGTKVSTSAYVHYDRVAQQVIDYNDIINRNTESMLLSMINDKIEVLNENDPTLELHNAVKVPAEMCVRRTGISFLFPPGEIAALEKGEIEVMLPHNSMNNIYTPVFKTQLATSTGWWKYKRLGGK